MADICVECGLPDPYHGDGDGIGSCDCPRCEDCGECRYCAGAFGLHHCDDDIGWDPDYDDDPGGWLDSNPAVYRHGTWRPVENLKPKEGLL